MPPGKNAGRPKVPWNQPGESSKLGDIRRGLKAAATSFIKEEFAMLCHVVRLPSLVALLGILSACFAQAADQPSEKAAGDQPAYKISLLLVERAVTERAPGADDAKPRTLSADEARQYQEAVGKEASAKVLSAPTIVTLAGQEALMTVGGEHTFVTGYDGDKPVLKQVPVGIELKTTPRPAADGRVSLDLELKTTELAGVVKTELPAEAGQPARAIELPTTRQRTLSTTVLLPPASASVIAGERRLDGSIGRRTEILVSVEEFRQ
jgi:Flp pilus assembly secretin CpaC